MLTQILPHNSRRNLRALLITHAAVIDRANLRAEQEHQ